MNKRNGFTLVELLAVIVILAVILAIAVPRISNMIDKAKVQAFIDSEKMIVKATKTYLSLNGVNMPRNIGDTIEVKLSELQNEKLIIRYVHHMTRTLNVMDIF